MVDDNPLLYRQARMSDIQEVVRIHQAAFPGFFMTLLGPGFLEKYYCRVLEFSGHIFWVKEGEEGLEGFVSGFLNPGQFYGEMRKHRWELFLAMLPRLLLRPWLIPRLSASSSQARTSSQTEEPGACELSSIAVLPTMGGRGLGKGLVKVFISAVQGQAQAVILTTDAIGNDSVNRFYRDLGFVLEGSYERSKGRSMNMYRLSLAATDSPGEQK